MQRRRGVVLVGAAAVSQWRLLEAALVTPMMVSASPRLSAGLLIAAGLFQFTPLKEACLARCRTPLGVVLAGAARPPHPLAEGLRNGAYCVGCCSARASPPAPHRPRVLGRIGAHLAALEDGGEERVEPPAGDLGQNGGG